MTGGRNRRGRAPRPFEYYRMIHAKKDYKGEAFNVLHDTMQITDTKGEAFDCIPTLGDFLKKLELFQRKCDLLDKKRKI